MDYDEMLAYVADVANESGYILNPDEQRYSRVVTGLVRNFDRYGLQYCPCQVPSGDENRDMDIVCPCKSCHDDIAVRGKCRCSLFVAGGGS